MIHLTDNEIAVLRSLANNNYGERGDGVWSFAINDSDTPSGITGAALGGVVSSLCKKGLISTQDYDTNEGVIWMKPEGAKIIAELKLCNY